MAIDLKQVKKIHFIGIGGSGVSALARMFLFEGKAVSGSDQSESVVTRELAKAGAKIFLSHDAKNIPPESDLVIHSIAITAHNPELLEAKRLTIGTLSYPEALGLISRDKFTIAVAGTHGKTTTTAMIAKIMIDAGLDPTVIVGSFLLDRQSNFIAGRGKYFVVEACEYRRSFLNLSPQILVITNIDNDHLDYYRDLDDIRSAFAELAAKVPADGRVITEKEYCRVKTDFKLLAPGAHNLRNAQVALAVAEALGIDPAAARWSLAEFRGTRRRFERRGETSEGALVYDDYAHHPTEVRATLAGAREQFPDRKIIVIFQPHLYSRTKLLFDDLAASFGGADQVLLLPVYAAREPFDPSVNSAMLAKAIGSRATTVPDFAAARAALPTLHASSSTLIITMGAGDISELPTLLLQSQYA